MISFKKFLIEEEINTYKTKCIELADEQRGIPEEKMLRVQMLNGGGVLNVVVEHAGDIIHRMNERYAWSSGGNAGYEYCKKKIEQVLRYLTDGYGFEKEMEENIKHNYFYKSTSTDVDPEKVEKFVARFPSEADFRDEVYKRLKEYGKAHLALPNYNRAQYLCRHLCFCIGVRQWTLAISDLYELKQHLKTPEEWTEFCRQES